MMGKINFMTKMQTRMNYMYTHHLLATNVASYGSLLALGDFVVQQIGFAYNPKETKYDYARTGRMIAIGCILGPFNHYWYTFLDKVIKGRGMHSVGKKIICDQLVAGPFFCSSFLFGTSLMEGEGVDGAIAEMKSKFLPIYMVDWAFWPAAQFINFKFLPSRFRVLYVGFVTLVWNSFLSFMKHRNSHAEASSVKTKVKGKVHH